MPLIPMSWLYRRLGKHFPAVFYLIQLGIGMMVTAGTLGLISFYYDASSAQLLKLLAISEALTVAGLTFGFVKVLKRMAPVKRWIAGERDPSSTVQAWDAAVNLPIRVMRDDLLWPGLLIGAPSVIAVVDVLDLGWTAFFPIFVAGGVAVVYAALLHYFAVETGMRPVVADIVSELPEDFNFKRLSLPVRTKLLTILPAINVITGLTVAALTSSGGSSLGVSVLIALAVAFTISFELTILLADSITKPVAALREGTKAIRRGNFDVQLPVMTSDDLGELTDGFNRMAAGLAERERLREAFGTYLDKEVAAYILSDDASPDGTEVEVTVVFCDVRNFTGFASDAEATEVVAELNQLFEALVPIVERYGGHVDKFIGDGLLAVFGVPERHEDHADRALAAAIDMVVTVESGEAGRLRIGAGINSGPVVAGSIGGGGRLNFSVIGDPVNVAARVESATRETGDSLLLTDATRGRLRRDVPLMPRGGVDLKGKREPVEVFVPRTLARDAAAASPASASAD